MIKQNKISLFFSSCIVLMTFVGAIVWQILCPFCSDDYMFSLSIHEGVDPLDFWMCRGEEYKSFGEVFDGMRTIFLTHNTRLSNLLYVLVQYIFPVWTVKTICGLSICGMYLGLLYFAVGNKMLTHPWIVAFATFFFWVFFPWSDSMQSSDFMFNYPVATCFVLIWLFLYRRAGKYRLVGRSLLALYTLFVAFYHEGFAIPLVAYLFVDMLLIGNKSKWYSLTLLIIFVIGIGVSPILGTGSRMGFVFNSFQTWLAKYQWERAKLFTDLGIGFLVLVCAAIARFRIKKSNVLQFRRDIYPSLAAVVASLGLCIVLHYYARAFWGGLLFAMIASLRLLSLIRTKKKLTAISQVVLTLLMVTYSAWLIELAIWQKKATNNQNRLVEILAPRGSYPYEVVYMDGIHRGEVPFYLMDITSPLYEVIPFNLITLKKYFKNPDGSETLIVLPEKFKDVRMENLPRYAGNARVRGDFPFVIFDEPYEGMLRVTFDSPNQKVSGVNLLRKLLFGGSSDDLYVKVESDTLFAPDSTYIFGWQIEELPRSFRGREIVRIDTVR